MAKITFNFTGWVRDAEINEVTITKTGKKKDVTHVLPDELIKNLRSGKWSIALGDHLYNNKESEIDLSDFEAGSVI